ncbi:tryptophan synthase alpha chain [Halolactibacillus alkaliphilus]|uniref:Tryptophan synthase alpha chain n=1 Tax=Halolactibacillus alkaliphilus TaxID=442899 RepID=A0A511X3Q8_9BACI|nr:tryptophan synthase subunit alpha [Halolactibacillus alkaliphilus]GEN57567.1 tryptophan synthase alpha chain [Halolactibacillus alkaliphilus]GGN73302.1 tryptophan synthase alpha chain [Halolactibacillus alkaliphilus]SFO96377.1 tryptophan synthase, alpha chain [Halolactibacillus alkaliphilus]
MSKQQLDAQFKNVLDRGDKLFVPYIMAGDGGLEKLNDQIKFLETAGASAIELGLPFSDPVADGETIQQAGIRSLKAGTTVKGVFETLKKSKGHKIPIILMTYMNPVFHYGVENFADACVEAGVSGLIVPDLPMEEESMVSEIFKAHDLALIRLVALTSPKSRREALKKRTEGFLYAVTVTGTTGERHTFTERVDHYLEDLKQGAHVPVLAGFGISTPDQVKALSKHADGVIVGSRIVKALHDGDYQVIESLIHASKKND